MLNKIIKVSTRSVTQLAMKTIEKNIIVNQNTQKLLSDSLQFVDINYFTKKNKVYLDCYNQKITHYKDPHLLSSIKIYYSSSSNLRNNYLCSTINFDQIEIIKKRENLHGLVEMYSNYFPHINKYIFCCKTIELPVKNYLQTNHKTIYHMSFVTNTLNRKSGNCNLDIVIPNVRHSLSNELIDVISKSIATYTSETVDINLIRKSIDLLSSQPIPFTDKEINMFFRNHSVSQNNYRFGKIYHKVLPSLSLLLCLKTQLFPYFKEIYETVKMILYHNKYKCNNQSIIDYLSYTYNRDDVKYCMKKLIDWKLIEMNENKEYVQLPNSILNSRIFLKKLIQYAYKVAPEVANKLKVNDWIEYIYGSNVIIRDNDRKELYDVLLLN